MLSNLLWFPWAQIGSEAPPTPGDEFPMGDRRVHHERIRRRPPDDDDVEALISVIADAL
jgi:hypothetical protein